MTAWSLRHVVLDIPCNLVIRSKHCLCISVFSCLCVFLIMFLGATHCTPGVCVLKYCWKLCTYSVETLYCQKIHCQDLKSDVCPPTFASSQYVTSQTGVIFSSKGIWEVSLHDKFLFPRNDLVKERGFNNSTGYLIHNISIIIEGS